MRERGVVVVVVVIAGWWLVGGPFVRSRFWHSFDSSGTARHAHTHARTHIRRYIQLHTYNTRVRVLYCTTVCRVCVHVHCRVFTWYICMDVMYFSMGCNVWMDVFQYGSYVWSVCNSTVWISKYMYGQQQAAARRMTRRQKGSKPPVDYSQQRPGTKGGMRGDWEGSRGTKGRDQERGRRARTARRIRIAQYTVCTI